MEVEFIMWNVESEKWNEGVRLHKAGIHGRIRATDREIARTRIVWQCDCFVMDSVLY